MEKSALLCLLFGVVFTETRPLNRFISHYEPLEYDHHGLMWNHHRVRRSLVGQRSLNLKFHALGRDFDLELEPDKHLFHPNFTMQDRGMPVKKGDVLSYLYTGTDKNDPTSHVHGNVVHGVFEGSIFTEEEMYKVEPASRYFEDADDPPSFHSVIYRLSDLESSGVSGRYCGATQGVLKSLRNSRNSVLRNERSEARSEILKRQAGRDPTKVRCWLNVIGDYKFFEAMTTPSLTTFERVSQATALLGSFIRDASTIYERTDFTNDGNDDLIEFGILNLDIESAEPDSGDFFADDFIGVDAFLIEHSRNNWDDYCLSYRFTYRDFDDGVLGLAYIGQPQRGGAGICAPFRDGSGDTLNTGIVTLLNYGQRVPSMVTALTFAHEAGHNFGSQHDPETEQCAPSSGGNFIMYAFASSGNAANNNEFSPCSRGMMDTVIAAKGQDQDDGCFVASDDNCGNGIVDEGEVCDCGQNNVDESMGGICTNDPCCNGATCNLTMEMDCSPDQGPCCNSSCQFDDSVMCAMQSQCALAQFCNGGTAACPDLIPRDEALNGNLTCSDGTGLCAADGTCTATVCDVLNLSSCECNDPDLSCHICCQLANGTCASTIRIAEENTDGLGDMLPDGMGRLQVVGFPCGNFTGYCDFFNNCMAIDSEGALDRLINLFSEESINAAIDWLRRMWWVVVIAGAGIIVGLFIVVLIVHLLLPRPEHVKRRAERRRSLRRSYKQRNRGGHTVTTGVELQNPGFVGQY